MVKIWYMCDDFEDQRDECHLDPPHFIDIDELKLKTGVLHWKFQPDAVDDSEEFQELKKSRGYTYEDKIEISPEKLAGYDEKIKIFFKEHIHTDEEIRFVQAGSGYFDVRDIEDKWIRIFVEPGDLLILPAGIYHRFTLDRNDYIIARRFFVGEPIWTPYNRPADEMEERRRYVQQMQSCSG